MDGGLTLHLNEDALVAFILGRAAAERRSPDNIVAEMVEREMAFAAQDARPVGLAVAADLASEQPRLLADEEETEEEFAQRAASFAALLSRP